MHKMFFLAVVATVAILTSGMWAAGLSKDYEICLNRENTNPAWAACGSEEIARQEKRLNETWSKKLKCFDRTAETWQKLVEEQRLWVKWKDAACRFYSARQKDGGTIDGREGEVLLAPACRAGIIADRADFLESLCTN